MALLAALIGRTDLAMPRVVVAAAMALISMHAGTACAASPAQSATPDNWAKCIALRGISIAAQDIGLPTRGATVTQARLVPASLTNPVGEYCLIDGEIAPVDAQAQPIRFRVGMPSRWNRKLVHFGSSPLGGAIASPDGLGFGPSTTSITAPPAPLARGYVVFASDGGHDSTGGGAAFTSDDEQLRNFAGEHVKKTHDAVLILLQARYGAAPVHSYFLGGGEGGRDALTVVQQYPEDYDGVIAMFPDFGTVATVLKMQVIARDMWVNDRAGWIAPAKADFLRSQELAACDGLDGLEDRIVSNVDACQFDFSALRCPEGKDSGNECFSDAQLRTLRDMHSSTPLPYSLGNDQTRLPGYRIGTDWNSVHILGKEPRPALTGIAYYTLIDSFVRHAFLRDPTAANTLVFDPRKPGKARARLQELATLLDRGGRVDIDRFIARGGKWILIHGQAEEVFSPLPAIEYYARLVARYGQARTDTFLRFYLIPGHGHFNAVGGPNLDALEEWVEHGNAPQALTVVDESAAAAGRSRPMCRYPAWPRYNGAGDPNLASSFSCALHR